MLFSAARHPWPELRRRVVEAEQHGFETAWVYDHLSGAVLGGSSMLECFTLAGALAAATDTIGIGTLVANAANRAAGLTVTAAATVQEISGGRFVLGLGAGAAPGSRWAAEHDVLGIPLPATMTLRHERVVEVLDLCDAMWDPLRDDRFVGFPLPSPRPPIVLGVNSEGLARLAGQRCDGLNVSHAHPRLREIIGAAREARAESPARCASPLSVSVWLPRSDEGLDRTSELHGRFAALGVDRMILVA